MAEAPSYAGGYAGEPTAQGGGGYDPFAPQAQNYKDQVAPDYRGGYAGEQTAWTGGGFDRNIGAPNSLKKPDGTPIEAGASPSNVGTGSAERTTDMVPTSPYGTFEAAQITPSILQSKPSASGNSTATNNFPNPLEQFASYAPLWTLAVLTKEQYNDPQTYRTSPDQLTHIVFSSAGRFDSQRQGTKYGTPEFYINNFTMTSVISPTPQTGITNANKFDFDVLEPYSMGLFLQSLQAAAVNAGYANYLDNAPFVLRLDIQGYDDNVASKASIKPKFFTIRISKATFQVTESGSLYKVEAVPYNELGFSDSIDITYNDLSLEFTNSKVTVEDLLIGPRGLISSLNEIEQNLKKSNLVEFPDEYVIEFPESSENFSSMNSIPDVEKRATSSPGEPAQEYVRGLTAMVSTEFTSNPIGKSGFGFDQSTGGNFPFSKAGDIYDSNTGVIQRDQMTINTRARKFQFAQGQKLTHIMSQVVLSSEYAKRAMDPSTLKLTDGFIQWFRIDVQIQLTNYDTLVGDYARRFIYRIVPFKVHHTIFSNVNAAPIGYDKLLPKISKRYDYIYTGQNSDVIRFDIDINNLFFKAALSSPANISGKANAEQSGFKEQRNKTVSTAEGLSPAAQLTNTLRSRNFASPEVLKPYLGGGGTSANTEQRVAETFHRAFIDGADMITVDLEILGDTYWLIESGMGNYFSKPTYPGSMVLEDGTANYENGTVFVYLSFKTPTEIDEVSGLYKRQSESPFGGIYRITKCESQFVDGIFKQKLRCIRMVGQAIDFDSELGAVKPDKDTSPTYDIGPDGTPNTSLAAYPNYNNFKTPAAATPPKPKEPVKAPTPANVFNSGPTPSAMNLPISNPFAGLPSAGADNSISSNAGARLLGGG